MNYRHALYLAPFALLLSAPIKADVEQMADVDNLKQTIHEAFKDNKNVAIKIYADWCGHCKRAAEPFKHMGEKHRHATKTVSINADNDALKDMITKFNVSGFPTFILVHKDKAPGYQAAEIKEIYPTKFFIKKLIGFSHEDLKAAMKEHAAKISMAPKIEKKAEIIEKKFSVKTLKAMHNLKEALTEAFADNKKVVLKIETDWCGACKAIAGEFKDLMHKHHKKLKAAIVNGENAAFAELLGKKLKVRAYPSFVFIQKEKAPGFEALEMDEMYPSKLFVKTNRGYSEAFKRDLAVFAGVPGAEYVTVTRITEGDEKVATKKPAKKHIEKAKKPVAKKAIAKKHHKKTVQKEICSQD